MEPQRRFTKRTLIILSAHFFMLMRPKHKTYTIPFCFGENSYMKRQKILSRVLIFHVGSFLNNLNVFDMSIQETEADHQLR